MRHSILFVGEENRTNNELYQLLNWRYKVSAYLSNDIAFEEIKISEIELIVVSMIGNHIDYSEWFDSLICDDLKVPVITISTSSESVPYERFYENTYFHKILRPVTGKNILAVCRAVIAGKSPEENLKQIVKKDVKQHILIVDDNAMVLRNIKQIIEPDYSVALAPSGVHAFIAMGKKKPDLILLDYEMPEMNGKQVLEKIREQEEYADVPVVFLTSMDSRETVIELLALQPAGYILKPVDSQVLLDRLEDIIGK